MVDSKMLELNSGVETNETIGVEQLDWASEMEEDGTFAGMLQMQHSEDRVRVVDLRMEETQLGAARLVGLRQCDLELTTIFLALVVE
ncbi:unnamed protein product [Cylindrotheca closterium]|uniref:Uncharacterized protein n=1 Tax=Cylindrotheca closterium TaxID=2856 RepID=A0AAD2FY41_9STRA|nr:unnamed protein product [Cylindrotheca closterium]